MNSTVSAVSLMTIMLLNVPMQAMDKEITYLFADKDTKSYDDHYHDRDGYDLVYISAPVFYHLVVQTLQSEPFKHDSRQELLERIRNNKIEHRAATDEFIMTQKDAYHRLLRYIPANGAKHVLNRDDKIYPALVNDVPSNLRIIIWRKALAKSSALLNSLCHHIIPNPGIMICISSEELVFSDEIFAKYKELIEQQ